MAISESHQVATAKSYFELVDARREEVLDLFTDDAQIYFPKFGTARGKVAVGELLGGLGGAIESIEHDVSNYLFLSSGNHVTVEGTTSGRMRTGETWAAGEAPGGRFCNVFEFRDGLIARLHVYLDPDYAGADLERFYWGRVDRSW